MIINFIIKEPLHKSISPFSQHMMGFYAWSILWHILMSYYIDTGHHVNRGYSRVEG